jgi:SAM-dependent methyltransferase
MSDTGIIELGDNLQLVRAPDGYWSCQPLPTPETLKKHYNDKYYGVSSEKGQQYSHEYTTEELEHKTLNAREALQFAPAGSKTLFELGVGEGFLLNHFVENGWDARGIDFTDAGLRKFFPKLLDRLATGDAYRLLDEYCDAGMGFDMVVCVNVLEHVLDPVVLLSRLKEILNDGGVCRISVPNDGSWLQDEVVKRKCAKPHFYLTPPEHLHYFTAGSLRRLFKRCGFDVIDILGDFPIDIFLLNPDTCYTIDNSKGRNCHFARVAFELGLWRQSTEKLIDFRKGCGAAGVGRNLIVYATPSKE